MYNRVRGINYTFVSVFTKPSNENKNCLNSSCFIKKFLRRD